MESLSELWENVRSYCEQELNVAAYKSWIEPINMLNFKDGTIFLSVRNPFLQNIVTDNYIPTLKAAFNSVLSFEPEIRILCEEENVTAIADENPMVDTAILYNNYDFTFETFALCYSHISHRYSDQSCCAWNI